MPRVDPILLARARAMRREMTPPERKLWHLLRAKRFAGYKFSRQVVIPPYIVDFLARAHRLIIEVDGDSHALSAEYDHRRTQFLSRRGYRVLRFLNADVLGNPHGVADAILAALNAPLPDPLPRGERAMAMERPS